MRAWAVASTLILHLACLPAEAQSASQDRPPAVTDPAAALAVPPAPVPPGRRMIGLKRVGVLTVADGPKSLEFMPGGGRVWTNNLYGNATQIIDAGTGRIERTMTWSGEPVEAGFREAGKEAWISLYDKDSVLVIDADTGALKDTIKVGVIPKVVAVSPDSRWVYTANWRPTRGRYTVSVIDAPTHTRVADIPVPATPRGIAFTPDGAYAYIAIMGGSEFVKVDVAGGHKVVGKFHAGGSGPRHLVADRTGRVLYASLNSAGRVVKYAIEGEKVIGSVRTGTQPRTIELSADERYLFVCNYRDNTLGVVDTQTMTQIFTARTGPHPIGVAAAPDGRRVWVANYSDRPSTIWVYDAVFEGEETATAQPTPATAQEPSPPARIASEPGKTYKSSKQRRRARQQKAAWPF